MKIPIALKNLYATGDKDFAEVVRHSFWAMVLLGFGTVIQFGFDFSLTHTFKARGSGIFYLCFSVLMTLALIGRLGVDRAVVRFMPPLLAENPDAAAGVKKAAIELSLLMTLPLTILLFFLAPVVAQHFFHSPDLTPYLRIFAFAIPALALNYVLSGILRSLKKTQHALSVERLTMYGLGIIAVLTLGRLFGLEGAVVGYAIGLFITTALGFGYVKRYHPSYKIPIHFSKKQMFIFSGPLLFVVFATQMNGQASVLLLGALGSNSDVGIFNIALKVSMIMNLVLSAVGVIIATKVAELYFAHKKQELDILISKVSALTALAVLPLFLVLVVFSHFLLGLFGSQFSAGSTALIILAVGQLINVSVGSTDYILAMTDHGRALAAAVGTSLVINIGLGLLLIPAYGVVGAGITAATTNIVANIIMVGMVKRYVGVWPLPFKFLKIWLKQPQHKHHLYKP